MGVVITGKDSISMAIMKELESGISVSEIPYKYPVSLDQSKRLSRYKSLLTDAQKYLSNEDYERVKLLGMKILPAAKFFRKKDWEAVSEVLSVVTDNTTRDELDLIVRGLKEKRDWIRNIKEDASFEIMQLKELQEDLLKEEKRIKEIGKMKELLFIRNRIREVENEISLIDRMMKEKYIKATEKIKLSVEELKERKALQKTVSSWLYKRGYVVAHDWKLPIGSTVSIGGYSEYGEIVIVEIIVSRIQLLNKRVWERFSNYCDELLLLPTKQMYLFGENDLNEYGILNMNMSIESPDNSIHKIENREELLFSLARTLSKN
jgi:hypothetical protein